MCNTAKSCEVAWRVRHDLKHEGNRLNRLSQNGYGWVRVCVCGGGGGGGGGGDGGGGGGGVCVW